jgi:hypothetical protein
VLKIIKNDSAMKKILFSIAGMLCFCYGTRAVNLNLNLTGNTQIGLIVIKNDTSLNIYMGGNTYFIAEIYYSVSQPGAINIYGTGSLTIAKITTQGTTNKHANSVGTINLYGKATLKIGDIKLSDGEHYKEAANSNGKIPGYCYCEPAHKGQCGSCKCNISSYESKKSIERGGNAACGGIYNIYDGSIMFENRITGGKGGDDAEFFMTATCAGLASIYIYPGDINPHGANHLAIVNILGGGNEEVKTSGLQITPSLNGHTEAKGGGNGGNIGYNDITLGRNNFPMTFNSCYDSTWSNVIVQSGWDKYAHNSRIGYTLTGYRTLNAPNDTTLTKCNNGALPFVKANNHVSSSDFGVTAICPNNTCDGVSLFAQWKANVYVIEFKPYAIARYGSQSPEYIGKDSAEYDSPMRRIDASGRTYLIPKGSDYTFEGHFSMLKQQQYTGKTYEGYTFAGYYADTVKISHENEMWTGHPDTIIKKGRQYYTPTMTSARIWDIPDNHPLYAHWIANKYHIELNKQGGSGGSDTALFTYDSAYTIPAALTAPTRTG